MSFVSLYDSTKIKIVGTDFTQFSFLFTAATIGKQAFYIQIKLIFYVLLYENIYGDYFKSWPKNKEQLARFTENCRKYIAYTKLVQRFSVDQLIFVYLYTLPCPDSGLVRVRLQFWYRAGRLIRIFRQVCSAL